MIQPHENRSNQTQFRQPDTATEAPCSCFQSFLLCQPLNREFCHMQYASSVVKCKAHVLASYSFLSSLQLWIMSKILYSEANNLKQYIWAANLLLTSLVCKETARIKSGMQCYAYVMLDFSSHHSIIALNSKRAWWMLHKTTLGIIFNASVIEPIIDLK